MATGAAIAIGVTALALGGAQMYQAHQQNKAAKNAANLQMQGLDIQRQANAIQQQSLAQQKLAYDQQAEASQMQLEANKKAQALAEESATKSAQETNRVNKKQIDSRAIVQDVFGKEQDNYLTSPWGDKAMNTAIKTLGAYMDDDGDDGDLL